jgi:hypothetical protein
MTWQPIETAPRDGTRVLVFWAPSIIQISWHEVSYRVINGQEWFRRVGWMVDGLTTGEIYPTHWMPLPDPPDQTTEQEAA